MPLDISALHSIIWTLIACIIILLAIIAGFAALIVKGLDNHIKLTPNEIRSESTRVSWAEGLIVQLPKTHDGRNSWLMNYGHKVEAKELRLKYKERTGIAIKPK